MIENNPSNVSSGFEMLLEDDSPHGTLEITEAGRARLAEGKQA